jgi:hypothetical protein
LIAGALAIVSATHVFAQCEDKSRQNADDEAGVKGVSSVGGAEQRRQPRDVDGDQLRLEASVALSRE